MSIHPVLNATSATVLEVTDIHYCIYIQRNLQLGEIHTWSLIYNSGGSTVWSGGSGERADLGVMWEEGLHEQRLR